MRGVSARRVLDRSIVTLSALLWFGPVPSAAQTYPDRAIRLVVPFAPGGPNDVLARLIGDKLSELWKQPIVVDNRGGGATVIGTDVVAKAPRDGYTLLMASTTTAVNPALRKKLPYDTLKNFVPVIELASSPSLLVVHPSSPFK